jgi:hypothetical protein
MRPRHSRPRRRTCSLLRTWWLGVFLAIFLGLLWWENVRVNFPDHPESSSSSRGRTVDIPAEVTSSKNSTIVKTWPFLEDSKKWCRPAKPEDITPGLIYVKIPKTGSSTMVGINIRISKKLGKRTYPSSLWWPFRNHHSEPCSFTYRHGRTELLQRQEPYLLWSFVRDPASRALSEFYHFEVSRRGRLPTDLWARSYLNERRNYQFSYLAVHSDPKALLETTFTTSGDASELIQRHVIQSYRFIGLLERKFESLAVMKLLWGLETEDLIVLSAKKSGGYDDGRFDGSCVRIQPSPKPLSPFLGGYIKDGFEKENIDFLLYAMVNQTLDRTIQSLGTDTVDREVEKLKALQTLAEDTCQTIAVFPCSPNGTLQLDAALRDCYWSDSGCGHACVDRTLH